MKTIKLVVFFLLILSLVGCGGGSSEEKTIENETLGLSNPNSSNDTPSNNNSNQNGNSSNSGGSEVDTTQSVKKLMKFDKKYHIASSNIIVAQENNTKIKLVITNSTRKTTAVLISGNAELK